MSTTKLKVGVVGCGILGINHARFFNRNRHTKVAAVADPLPGRAEKVAGEVGACAFPGFPEMLAKERLDLVVVATPDPLQIGRAHV